MIIFFFLLTGVIAGTIDGRVHTDAQLKMWIGDKHTNERIVIPWTKIIDSEKEIEAERMQEAGKDMQGNMLFRKVKIKEKVYQSHFEPEHTQKELIIALDKGKESILDYAIDVKTKMLVAKTLS